MAATSEAPRTPALNTRRPKFSPRSGDSARLISPTLSRPADAPPEASVAAAATSTAPVKHWVSTAPNAVSQRAALR